MNPYALLVMLSSLGIGTTMTASSSHWLAAWMGLELNTLAIIPLMINHHHPRATEAATKYFLTQATASALIMFSTIMNAWSTGQWDIKEMSNLTSNMLTIALAMKLGLAPLHFWLPEVLQGITLTTGLILSTWQKIAPMILIYMTSNSLNFNLLMILGITSTVVGGWGGLNQTQTRKIMAYSSIAHLGWMMIIIMLLPKLALLNFLLYLTMTSSLFITLMLMNSTNINSLSMSWPKMPVIAALSPMILFSLGGLPPTTGFMPKWFILNELIKYHATATATIMAFSALLSLFFYLRLAYSFALTQSPNTMNSYMSWRHKINQPTMMLAIPTVMSIALLPMTPNLLSW
uniref:NADH-ubiquinone oxidoreductase chain 2 n=1 Tax=Boulengerula taitana TaxID=102246 RepID=C8UZQ8_BOUTA|nr:NADH dehydrogenase subunit 2 [Boulengerula taitana]AAX58636.1 NADH dehydrogenase subunit 2 [Boulengerula taitana]ACS37015.1 NADH dehydrogenase subunit 2 [Boulengerula taitana]